MAERATPQALEAEPGFGGCTRLCQALTALGLGLSTAAALFTHNLLHEPMESVGSAVVDHMASAHCTALTNVLTGLSIARGGADEPAAHAENRASPDSESSFGVLNLTSGALENFHSSSLTEEQARGILAGLPREVAAGSGGAPNPTPRIPVPSPGSYGCPGFGYGLQPQAVRVHLIDRPGHGHGHGHHGGTAGPPAADRWVAFIHGPESTSGGPRTTFALVDLKGLTERIGGHDHSLDHFVDRGKENLQLETTTLPFTILGNRDTLKRVLPDLPDGDDKLARLRLVPFANQVMGTRVSVNHDALSRVSVQAAASVFLLGLLATAAVVLVSRSSQRKLERLNRELARESRTDGLTRVANRRAWDEALATAESRRRRHGEIYGLIVIDLDGFKQINDELGHQSGDAVLQDTARQLKEGLRASDVLARVGGDEFALLLYRPEPAAMADLASRLKTRLARAGIRASVGFSLCTPDRSIEESWSQADQSMYVEKRR